MNRIVDSHCHLNFPQFKGKLDGIVKRALDKGIYRMLTISTKLNEISELESISKSYSEVYNSVGVHPHECKNYENLSLDDLIKHTENSKCIGIGESGLDFYYENSPKELQNRLFKIHIEAARETNLPLIVHTRNADSETIETLNEEMKKGAFTGLIHCFSTSRELAKNAINLGFYISLSGIITFNKSNDLRNIIKDLPLDRLLLETDAPYLAPEPFRGKCNEPSYVIYTAKILSDLKNEELDVIAEKTTDNFNKLFNL
jgi:TatD DNase family protein